MTSPRTNRLVDTPRARTSRCALDNPEKIGTRPSVSAFFMCITRRSAPVMASKIANINA